MRPFYLQKVVLDQFGDFEGDFVTLRQGSLSDELHNFGQIFFLLENFLALGPQRHKLGKVALVVVVESTHVLAVADEPVDRGEVFALRQLLVQTPKHLHDAQRGRRDGVGKVATGRRHGPHNTDTSLTSRIACKKKRKNIIGAQTDQNRDKNTRIIFKN